MSEQDNDRAFEARTKAAFDASVDALDAGTRSRLTQARVRALDELGARRSARFNSRWLLPAGAAAAAALAAWVVLVQGPQGLEPPPQVAAWDDFELLTAAEDLEMIEELEFYAWLEEQPEFDAAADGVPGDGVG